MKQPRKILNRNALLAKIHIAKKELGLDDDLYREILQDEFGVGSAADLRVEELEGLVARFEAKGWQSRAKESRPGGRSYNTKTAQAEALRDRARQAALHTELNEKRFRGLVKKICGVDELEWCGEAVRLKRLVAVIESMVKKGRI